MARTILAVFPTFAIGGAQARYVALANHLGGQYRHVIVALDSVITARETLAPALETVFPDVSVTKGALLGNRAPIRAALRAFRPDILLTHNWGSMDWALANIPRLAPHIHIEDGFGPEERDRQLPRRVLTRRIVLRRSTVVLPSRNLERIARQAWRLPASRLRYVPNGIDLGRFAPPRDAPLRRDWQGEGPVIGTVAALRPEKNLARLLRAFAALDVPARLVIVGDGAERGSLQSLAASLGIARSVTFTGHSADPAPLIAGFDIFALSSDTEQMPLSLIEAMAACKPVAATDVGDVRLMLPAENQDFVVPRDEMALSRAIGRLARDASLRHRLGAANRARAERDYDRKAMFRAYAELFEDASRA